FNATAVKESPDAPATENAARPSASTARQSTPQKCSSTPKIGFPRVRSSRTCGVQYTARLPPSLSIRSPVVWSIWASISTMARIPVSRMPRPGCSRGKARSWVSTSGEALNRTHSIPSAEAAMEDWVRGRARIVPLRTPSQLRQLQFHCGRPPPAADPSTRMCIKSKAPRGALVSVPAGISGWRCTSSPRSRNASRCIQAWSTCVSPEWKRTRRGRAPSREHYGPKAPGPVPSVPQNHDFHERAADNAPSVNPADSTLYPPLEPFAEQQFPVGGGHALHVEQCGNPAGFPVFFLHGGPGSQVRPVHRRFFDPAFYRVVLFDQRGCGRSTPGGRIEENTTPHLVRDIEALRGHLGLERLMLFGGSWGATLALAYAAAHPGHIAAMVLRGVFLGSREEVDWYLGGLGQLVPRARQALALGAGADLLEHYHGLVTRNDAAAAARWVAYEDAVMRLDTGDSATAGGARDPAAVLARAR